MRDVTFGQDAHQACTGTGPTILATLHNTAISLLRTTGQINIACAAHHYARRPHNLITLVTSRETTTQ